MAWWNDFVTWFNSPEGQRVFLNAILPFLAIVVAGVIAAIIGSSASRRVIERSDRELKGAAVAALIAVGRRAALWSSLGGDEKQHVDALQSDADIRVRLLPVNGASQAADWAAHQLGDMKKNSASFSFQTDQTFHEYRDRLLEWQQKPGRAKKLFAFDLAQWKYEDDAADTNLTAKQQEWATAHVEPANSPIEMATTTPPAGTPSTGPLTSVTPSEAAAASALTSPTLGDADPPSIATIAPATSEPVDTTTRDIDVQEDDAIAPPVSASSIRRSTGVTPPSAPTAN
jgi:hypothetical protein